MPFYAVRSGNNPGIYTTWEDCKKHVIGFKGSVYKKFTTEDKALKFINSKENPYKKKSNEKKYKNKFKSNINLNLKADTTHNVYIFTDGSSIGNGSANSKAGYGIYMPDTDLKLSKKLDNGSTNNIAELTAIYEALKMVDTTKTLDSFTTSQSSFSEKNIVIVTDSKYSIQCITEWYSNWVRRKWIKSNGEPVANKQLIISIYTLYVKHDIDFKHINSHTNKKGFFYEGNAIVDELASSAAKS
jgi:ribonuclease HI